MAFSLSDRQRFDWLRLIRTDRVGPRTFRGLVNRFGAEGEALAALPELSRAAGQRVTPPGEAEIEREMALARRLGCRFVALGESDYPVTLAATHQAPPLLCVRGDAGALGKPMVAIVGSRNASGPGMTFAERLAAGLSQAGIVVVSGLARGIDAAAHRASLNGGTVAVLAGGQGRIYPPQHADWSSRSWRPARSSRNRPSSSSLAPRISRAATGSWPACRSRPSWSKRRALPAR